MMTDKSPIEKTPLTAARIEQVEQDLRSWAEKPIDISFDPKGTPLFSMMELAHSYARRCVDLTDAICLLLARNHIIPAAVLGRALIETVAMGCLYLHDMGELIAAKDHDRLESKLARFYAGVRGQKIEPVHVMDAMRHLDKVDAAHIEYLDSKYGVFTRFMEVLKARGEDVDESFGETVSVIRTYDLLSEVSHPNGTGTQFLFPDESNETEAVAAARTRFRGASLMAIWHGRHLVAALEQRADFPERYRTEFGTGEIVNPPSRRDDL